MQETYENFLNYRHDIFIHDKDIPEYEDKDNGLAPFTDMKFPQTPRKSFVWDINYKMKKNYPHIFVGRSNITKEGENQFSSWDNWTPNSLEIR